MQVVHIKTGEICTVYGIHGTRFLFWNKEAGCWENRPIEEYKPLEGKHEQNTG